MIENTNLLGPCYLDWINDNEDSTKITLAISFAGDESVELTMTQFGKSSISMILPIGEIKDAINYVQGESVIRKLR